MLNTIEALKISKAKVKLLIVDDREDNLLSIETILEKDGYTITKADSGRNALKILLREQDFTLILMDVQMPDLNGFETAEMIYESDKLKRIPIIFITANDYGDESIFKGYQLGGVDYLYKPINPELLRAKVAVFVELYNKNMQLTAHEQYLTVANQNLEKEIAERQTSEKKVRLLNEQLEESIAELQRKNEELEQFAFGASHDLQEPLRKIIVFGSKISAQCQELLDEENRYFLERMIMSSKRMQQLINNLLTFSKLNNINAPYEISDLNALLDIALSDLEISIAQKQAIFNIDKLPALNVIPDELIQVFQNIITNSLKYAKTNVIPEINISAELVRGKDIRGISEDKHTDEYWNIYIRDNGIGFDPEYADQIFVVFKRLHAYHNFEGTGIGLSICKKIVEKHNGVINAIGEPDKGATFIISLPMQRQHIEIGAAITN